MTLSEPPVPATLVGGGGLLRRPWGIAVDPLSGEVFVAEEGGHRIHVFH